MENYLIAILNLMYAIPALILCVASVDEYLRYEKQYTLGNFIFAFIVCLIPIVNIIALFKLKDEIISQWKKIITNIIGERK